MRWGDRKKARIVKDSGLFSWVQRMYRNWRFRHSQCRVFLTAPFEKVSRDGQIRFLQKHQYLAWRRRFRRPYRRSAALIRRVKYGAWNRVFHLGKRQKPTQIVSNSIFLREEIWFFYPSITDTIQFLNNSYHQYKADFSSFQSYILHSNIKLISWETNHEHDNLSRKPHFKRPCSLSGERRARSPKLAEELFPSPSCASGFAYGWPARRPPPCGVVSMLVTKPVQGIKRHCLSRLLIRCCRSYGRAVFDRQ